MGCSPLFLLTLLQSDQWRYARLSFQTVKNGLVICSMWAYFAFSQLLGMEMEDPSLPSSSPFDFRACTHLWFTCTGPRNQHREDSSDSTQQKGYLWVREGGPPQGGVEDSSRTKSSEESPPSLGMYLAMKTRVTPEPRLMETARFAHVVVVKQPSCGFTG